MKLESNNDIRIYLKKSYKNNKKCTRLQLQGEIMINFFPRKKNEKWFNSNFKTF